MAEVFGLAAAGIGVTPVALELAKTVKKLKDYCRDVKTARQDIHDFVDEVDALNHVLQDLEALNIADCPSSSQALHRCRQLCKKANTTLSEVLTEVQAALALHGKRTQLTFPLKRDKMEQLTSKVANAQRSLSLACNVYLMWQNNVQAQAQKRQTQMMSDMFAIMQTQHHDHNRSFKDLISGNSVIRSSLTSRETPKQNQLLGPRVHGDESRQQARGRRALADIWSSLLLLTTKGWTNFFRSYRVVPDSLVDPAFSAIRQGDITSLQRLICAGEASIYDRTTDRTIESDSMLVVAARSGRLDILRWLHQMGAHIGGDVLESEKILQAQLVFGSYIQLYFSREFGVEDLSEDATFIKNSFEFEPSDQYPDAFERHLDWEDAPIYALAKPMKSWTCSEVFELTVYFMRRTAFSHFGPNTLLKSLLDLIQSSSWGVEIWQQRDAQGMSLIHALALAYSGLPLPCHSAILSQRATILADFLKQAIRAGADLHAVSRGNVEVTPLAIAIFGGELQDPSIVWSDGSLQHWVGILFAEGIGIEEYGQVESEAWLHSKHVRDLCERKAYGFIYGRQPQDWKVFLEHPGDHYAGLFWDLVEHPERQVPGAWKDDDGRLWDDRHFQLLEIQKYWRKLDAGREYERKDLTTCQEVQD